MVDQHYYPLPISKLLSHGPLQTSATGQWFNYVDGYGLSESDMPELLCMIIGVEVDRGDPVQGVAPIHACRTLGQLGDAAACDYLVRLLTFFEDSGLTESALVALSMLGPRSLSALQDFFDEPEVSHWSQALAAEGIRIFAQDHPEYADDCISFLQQALAHYAQHTPELNAFLCKELVELKGTEAAEVMAKAFRAGRVDLDICGTWPALQVELGLANEADFSSEELEGRTLFEREKVQKPASAPSRAQRRKNKRQKNKNRSSASRAHSFGEMFKK